MTFYIATDQDGTHVFRTRPEYLYNPLHYFWYGDDRPQYQWLLELLPENFKQHDGYCRKVNIEMIME